MDRIEAINRMLKSTITYQVGELVISARSSLKSCILLPWRLYKLHKSYGKAINFPTDNSGNIEHHIKSQFSDPSFIISGLILSEEKLDEARIVALLDRNTDDPEVKSKALLMAAKVTASSSVSDVTMMAELVLKYDQRLRTKQEVVLLLHRIGHVFKTVEVLDDIAEFEERFSNDFRRRATQIRNEADYLKFGLAIPTAQVANPSKAELDILYVSSMSLPHHTTGYATRTHSIMKALNTSKVKVNCVTRPGYPWDRGDARHLDAIKDIEVIEEIKYQHLKGQSSFQTPFSNYVKNAAEVLVATMNEQRPKLVIAGSDYINAMPALFAAKQAGVPFVYDMRGLWEHTAASKILGWDKTDRFLVSKKAETQIAAEADAVFTISAALRDEMINRGVDGSKIQVLQNSVDMTRFNANRGELNKRRELGIPDTAIVFGFVGSIEPYEGTDDLVRAFKQCLEVDIDAYLLIVGDGSYARQLNDLAASLDMADRIRFPGRVPFADVLPYCKSCDVFVYPRKRLSVTELVPALKPLEAMALGKPVILTQVRAMVELVGGDQNAEICEPDDHLALSKAIIKLAQNPNLRAKLGENGKAFVRENRNWDKTIDKIKPLLV